MEGRLSLVCEECLTVEAGRPLCVLGTLFGRLTIMPNGVASKAKAKILPRDQRAGGDSQVAAQAEQASPLIAVLLQRGLQ